MWRSHMRYGRSSMAIRRTTWLAGRMLTGVTLQVDVYGVTGTSVRAVRDAIRDAIELQANVARWGGEARDPTTKNYRTSFDVDWIVQR